MDRAEMERIIKEEQRSVVYQGRVLSRVEDLPSDAELAGDNPKAQQAAREKLEAEARRIQEQLAQLQRGQNTFAGEAEGAPTVPTETGPAPVPPEPKPPTKK